jgi:hypothetical protein
MKINLTVQGTQATLTLLFLETDDRSLMHTDHILRQTF